MPPLSAAKRRVATALGSSAAVSESRQTMLCADLSAALLDVGGLAVEADVPAQVVVDPLIRQRTHGQQGAWDRDGVVADGGCCRPTSAWQAEVLTTEERDELRAVVQRESRASWRRDPA